MNDPLTASAGPSNDSPSTDQPTPRTINDDIDTLAMVVEALGMIERDQDQPEQQGHSIAWTIDRWQVQGTVKCHEADGADCRLRGGPGCECESWAPLRDEAGRPFHEVDGYDDKGADTIVRHYMVSGDCSVAEWIDNDGAEDCYADGEHPLVDGPISVEWTDPGYSWSYVDTAGA